MADTNILLYAHDRANPIKRERAIAVTERLQSSRTGALSTQILGEFFVNAARKVVPPLTHRQAEDVINALLEGWTVFDVTSVIVQQAVRDVQRHQLSYWDALIIATARANGVGTVLTVDRTDGAVYDGVRTVNPLAEGFDLATLSRVP